ncbi:hypothetical protein IH982_01560 [Patescibacteria group bacterium]|nr:hypothetical protein [Patescibacteria group bacterium]
MGTTIEDVLYEEHLEDLHKAYTNALEKLAESKSLADLRKNLESLQDTKASLPKGMTENEDLFESMESTLNEIATLEGIYKVLIEQKKKGGVYFIAGLGIGSIVTVLSSLFL